MATRTTLVDNNTWNNSHIALVNCTPVLTSWIFLFFFPLKKNYTLQFALPQGIAIRAKVKQKGRVTNKGDFFILGKNNILKFRFKRVQFSISPATTLAIAMVPTIKNWTVQNPNIFVLDFKSFLTKWWPFGASSNGWASIIRTICKPTSF